jgi:hypothetical protein
MLSLMVAVIRGPGMAAPEKAMRNDVAKMVKKVSTALLYQ